MNVSVTLVPRLSEKVYALSEKLNTYVFEVPKSANKHQIAKAVTEQYAVAVTKVRVATVPGKTQRSYRKSVRKTITGRRSDIRKAYVTLKEGDTLPIFAAVENNTKPKETK